MGDGRGIERCGWCQGESRLGSHPHTQRQLALTRVPHQPFWASCCPHGTPVFSSAKWASLPALEVYEQDACWPQQCGLQLSPARAGLWKARLGLQPVYLALRSSLHPGSRSHPLCLRVDFDFWELHPGTHALTDTSPSLMVAGRSSVHFQGTEI